MKGKQLFILLVLAAIAGGVWYSLSERNHASWSATGGGGGKVIELPINEVAHVRIKSADGEVNLLKKNDAWTVQERADYPANFEQVSGLVRKVWDLKTVQEVKVGASQLPRLDLVEPGQGEHAGTEVAFLGADGKTLGALLLGKPYVRKPTGSDDMGMGGFPTGRYVKPLNGAKVSLVSDPLDDAVPKPEHWLAKDFVKIDGPKAIAVTGQTEAAKWTVTRPTATAEWALAEARPDEKLDPNKTFAFGSILSAPSFDDVLKSDAKPEETGLDKPTVATIATFDGFRYEVKIGKAMGENFPVTIAVSAEMPKERTAGKDEKPEDKKKLDEEFHAKQKRLAEKLDNEQKFASRAYLLPKPALEPLLQERSVLLASQPATPPPAAATSEPIPVSDALKEPTPPASTDKP